MDKLEQYRNIIKKILTEYYEMTNNQTSKKCEFEVSERLAIDKEVIPGGIILYYLVIRLPYLVKMEMMLNYI
ncbi:element excision factor XisI family protein [Cuspidothrix issatschenkoi]|jgi:hypothetical protein|uniref:element excision factor XisI family protein n=1 Tax=Cuspidothrix issatschenkoi TaxID=230752 RepID=UPI0010575D65|nr:element excision factor XisI family protein [Cuspidothrix issatschenkoi]